MASTSTGDDAPVLPAPVPRRPPPARGWRRRGRLLAAAFRPPARPLAAELMAPRAGVASRSSRLVPEPVFVLSPIRAGSTLLRVLLNSHSQIRAPHEMHLRTLHVTPAREFSEDAMADLGLDKDELEHLLWDRILHLELQRSGKSVIVDKTPANVLVWKRLRRAWPQAKYLVLLRDPAAIVESVVSRRVDGDRDAAVTELAGYAHRLEAARRALPCLTLRYEDLTVDPAAVTRRICAHLGVDWEPTMLEYGRYDHGGFRPFAGDWSDNIRSGTIQPARRPAASSADDARIRTIAADWGYPGS